MMMSVLSPQFPLEVTGGIIDRIWNKQYHREKTTKSKSIIKKTYDFLRDQQKLESVNTHDALESFDVVFSVHCYS